MRLPAIPLILALSAALNLPGVGREFEDKFGRTIEAELVSHTGVGADTVTIEKDGKQIKAKLSLFSAKDQAFIRDWMKSTPPKLDYAFRVEAEKKKLSSTSSGTTSSRSKSQVYVYEVKVTNLTRQPVRNISIEYLAFMKSRYGRGDSHGDTIKVKGPMRYNQTATFTTEPFKLDSYRSTYSSYGYKDSLLGALVRVRDPQGNIIEDFRTTGTGFKATWPKPETDVAVEPKPDVILD